MNKQQFLWCGAAAVMVLAAFFLSACAMDRTEMESINHASAPVISSAGQPGTKQFASVATAELTVVATTPDGGTLSYQWYSYKLSSEYDALQGDEIDGATLATFIPTDFEDQLGVLQEDVIYNYYVIVTNTREKASGRKRVSVQSNPAAIVITDPNNAAYPFIVRQPVGGIYILKRGLSISLSMAAFTERGDMTYQWYQTDVDTN
jgi:hypothetical protein